MPKLDTYTAKLRDFVPGSTTDYVPGRDVNASVQNLSNTAMREAENSLLRIEQTDIAAMQSGAATARAELNADLDNYVTQYGMDPHDQEFTSRFLEQSADKMAKYENGVSTAAGRMAHSKIMEGMLGEFAIRIDQKQSEMAGAKAKADLTTMLNANSNLLFGDPQQFVPAMQEQTLLISLNEDLTFEQKEQMTALTRSSLAAATVRGIAKDDPQGALDQMATGMWDVFLDASTRMALVGSLTGRLVTEAKETERRALLTKKLKGEEEIKNIMKLDDAGTLSHEHVMGAMDWLTPSDFKMALALVNNTEPDADNQSALLLLEDMMRDNPELVVDSATFLFKEGMIKASTLRTYSSAGRTAARQEGFKSQRERSADSMRINFKPGAMDKYDPARNAKYASAMAEYYARTDAVGMSDEDIMKVEKSVINKWHSGNVEKNAWQTTNHGVIIMQKRTLIEQARVLEGMLNSGAMNKDVFRQQYLPVVQRLKQLTDQEQALERGK